MFRLILDEHLQSLYKDLLIMLHCSSRYGAGHEECAKLPHNQQATVSPGMMGHKSIDLNLDSDSIQVVPPSIPVHGVS